MAKLRQGKGGHDEQQMIFPGENHWHFTGGERNCFGPWDEGGSGLPRAIHLRVNLLPLAKAIWRNEDQPIQTDEGYGA